MNTQPTHEDDIFKEKRKPKNPIKFKLQLNEEQKEAYWSQQKKLFGDKNSELKNEFLTKSENEPGIEV